MSNELKPKQLNTKQSNSYVGLEQIDVREQEVETAKRVSTIDDAQYTITDELTSTLTYIGESRNPTDPDETAAEWRVRRIFICGCVTTESYANDGRYISKWSERNTLFPTPTFDNVYSTDFDGINDYTTGGDVHKYDSSDQFTITGWFNPQNVSAQRALFAKATNDANVYGYILYHNASGNLLLQMRAPVGLRSFTFASQLVPDTWQFVALTYAGANNINGARAYYNGVVDALTPSSGPITNSWLSGQDFTLGSRNSTFVYSGLIDEVVVWDQALTADEVLEMYNDGVPMNPSQHSASQHAMSWYRMGDGDSYPAISDNIAADNLTMVNMSADAFVEDVP